MTGSSSLGGICHATVGVCYCSALRRRAQAKTPCGDERLIDKWGILHMFSPRTWVIGGSVTLLCSMIGVLFLGLRANRSQTLPPLCIDPAKMQDDGGATRVTVVPDELRQKYSTTKEVAFHVTCSRANSIFVLATGVQILTPSGWRTISEEYRSEIWRLSSRVAREVCVERPDAASWRAYLRYGTEMKGVSLIKAQLREAWLTRSFSNWTGKAWGGGRWSGANELLSKEITE